MTTRTMQIRAAARDDSAACAEIFAHYVLHTAANLEETPPAPEYFSRLIEDPQIPFFVACENEEICGYAYADVLRSRCGYRRAMEVSVYVAAERIQRGGGGKLMDAVLRALREDGMRAAVSFITLPNPRSVRLHEKYGFVRAGVMPGVGWKFNRAHDVGIWVNNLV
ncbi:MAG: GNAT family N-acetyltransferase [Gammaproteobacteria bacterium]